MDEIRKGMVFCLPSVTSTSGDQEGLPQVLLEAGSLGRPVIATLHSGIPEGVLDGESAHLVSERSPYELAEALVYVLSNARVAQEMGTAGRNFVLRNFDVRQQSAKVEALYDSLL